MRTALQRDDHRLELRAGATDDRLHFTLAVTNIGDTELTATSSMGAWGTLRLVDDAGTQRLEPMAPTAAIEYWTIPPGETLVTTRATRTPAEVTDTEIPRIEYVADEDEANPDDSLYYAPNVGLPLDAETQMTVTGTVDLGEYSGSLSLTFTPADLTEPVEPDSAYTIVDDPTPDRTGGVVSPENYGFSVSYCQQDPE